jgi:hypothetical protein
VDDVSFPGDVPDDELAAVRRALAGLGEQPLPGAVATRLDARLTAELDASPLARRRARRPRRLAASLTAAAGVVAAAAVVFALSTGGGHKPAGQSEALRSTTEVAVADSSAKSAAGAAAPKTAFALHAACPPASRKAGGRPSAACPGARGGHARAV